MVTKRTKKVLKDLEFIEVNCVGYFYQPNDNRCDEYRKRLKNIREFILEISEDHHEVKKKIAQRIKGND